MTLTRGTPCITKFWSGNHKKYGHVSTKPWCGWKEGSPSITLSSLSPGNQFLGKLIRDGNKTERVGRQKAHVFDKLHVAAAGHTPYVPTTILVFSYVRINAKGTSLNFMPARLSMCLTYRVTQKKTGTFETPNKNWRNPRNKKKCIDRNSNLPFKRQESKLSMFENYVL